VLPRGFGSSTRVPGRGKQDRVRFPSRRTRRSSTTSAPPCTSTSIGKGPAAPGGVKQPPLDLEAIRRGPADGMDVGGTRPPSTILWLKRGETDPGAAARVEPGEFRWPRPCASWVVMTTAPAIRDGQPCGLQTSAADVLLAGPRVRRAPPAEPDASPGRAGPVPSGRSQATPYPTRVATPTVSSPGQGFGH